MVGLAGGGGHLYPSPPMQPNPERKYPSNIFVSYYLTHISIHYYLFHLLSAYLSNHFKKM